MARRLNWQEKAVLEHERRKHEEPLKLKREQLECYRAWGFSNDSIRVTMIQNWGPNWSSGLNESELVELGEKQLSLVLGV